MDRCPRTSLLAGEGRSGIEPLRLGPVENTTMAPIDIHHYHRKLQAELRNLTQDQRLLDAQRRTILRFVSDARSGRIGRRSAATRVSDGRCMKYVYHLRRFALYVGVPFEDVTDRQMQDFIFGLEDGTIRKQYVLNGTDRFSVETVLDFKRALRRFYKWLFGEGTKRYHDLTDWIDTRNPVSEPEAITFEQARQLAECQLPQGKAMLLAWFDGGYRPGELFNLCLRDVRFATDSDGQMTCYTTIRVSKTKPRTISLPLATEAMALWLKMHPHAQRMGSDGRIETPMPDAPLFTWSYDYTRKVMRQVGKAILEARLYPYRFRHSSATYYARYLSRYQLCARYGWTMSSSAPDRYIDRSGVLAEDTASVIREAQRKQAAAPSTPSLPPPDRWAA